MSRAKAKSAPPTLRRPAVRAVPDAPPAVDPAASSTPGGLAAQFGFTPEAFTTSARELPLDVIEPNPDQPRSTFDQQALEGLAGSIRELGVLQAITVRPAGAGRYQIVMGERRWRASRLAGRTTIPAQVEVDLSDDETLERALVENTARDDLNVVEEARSLALLRDRRGLTQQQLASRVGKSRSEVANTIRLLALPDAALDLLASGQLTRAAGRTLLGEPDYRRQRALAEKAASEGWTVAELERAVAKSHSAPRAARAHARADQDEVAVAFADRLDGAFTAASEVKVRSYRDGFRIEVTCDSLAAAEAVVTQMEGAPR